MCTLGKHGWPLPVCSNFFYPLIICQFYFSKSFQFISFMFIAFTPFKCVKYFLLLRNKRLSLHFDLDLHLSGVTCYWFAWSHVKEFNAVMHLNRQTVYRYGDTREWFNAYGVSGQYDPNFVCGTLVLLHVLFITQL